MSVSGVIGKCVDRPTDRYDTELVIAVNMWGIFIIQSRKGMIEIYESKLFDRQFDVKKS